MHIAKFLQYAKRITSEAKKISCKTLKSCLLILASVCMIPHKKISLQLSGREIFCAGQQYQNIYLLCCAKNLGDSLVGIRYIDKGNGVVAVEGNGDASFLMSDFKSHPVFDFLKNKIAFYSAIRTGRKRIRKRLDLGRLPQ